MKRKASSPSEQLDDKKSRTAVPNLICGYSMSSLVLRALPRDRWEHLIQDPNNDTRFRCNNPSTTSATPGRSLCTRCRGSCALATGLFSRLTSLANSAVQGDDSAPFDSALSCLTNLAPRLAFEVFLQLSLTREVNSSIIIGDFFNKTAFDRHVERYRTGCSLDRRHIKKALLNDFDGTLAAIKHDVKNYELLHFLPPDAAEEHPIVYNPIVAIVACLSSQPGIHFVNGMNEDDHGPIFNRHLARAMASNLIIDENVVESYTTIKELEISSQNIVMVYENEHEENMFSLPKSLIKLNISHNRLLSLNFVQGLPNLIELNVSFAKIDNSYQGDAFQDLTPIQNCKSLCKLNICGNNDITDLSPLESLTSLIELDVSATGYESMASIITLSDHGTLRSLTMGSNFCTITDFDACIPRLTGLTELVLRDQNNYVGDNTLGEPLRRRADHIGLVSNLTNLTTLDLNSQDLRDINGLVGMTNLTNLSLENNPIQNVTPLNSLLLHVANYTGPRIQQPLPPPSTTPAFENGMSEVDFQQLQSFPYIKPGSISSISSTSSTSSSSSSSSETLATESSVEDEMCVICLEEFVHDESIIALPRCLHKYHPACLKEHVLTDKKCPMCREVILNGEGGGGGGVDIGKNSRGSSPRISSTSVQTTCNSCHRSQEQLSGARFCTFCGSAFE